jgi:hypothetical protein
MVEFDLITSTMKRLRKPSTQSYSKFSNESEEFTDAQVDSME